MKRMLWEPEPSEDLAIDKLKRFAKVSDFQSLHKWSIENEETFWRYVFEDSGVVGTLGDKAIIDRGFLDSQFFPDAKLNIVDTLLKGSDDQIVITEIDCIYRTRRPENRCHFFQYICRFRNRNRVRSI